MFENLEIDGLPAYSVQPATTPPGAAYATVQGGTEYLVSSMNYLLLGDNKIAAWAISNTSSINLTTPSLALHQQIIPSQVYHYPSKAIQKDGPRPLGELLGEPVPQVEANDERMQQAVYSNNALYVSLCTRVGGAMERTGVAYFVIGPGFTPSGFRASVLSQGYITLADSFLLFPAIAVNKSGRGIVAFSIVGPNRFPSVGYSDITMLTPLQGPPPVKLIRNGGAPEDGFTGYAAFSFTGQQEPARWGDYSTAFSDESGRIWLNVEYIRGNDLRTFYTNWASWIGRVTR
jgi:hypothetical protein